jgi:hypoxanthine-DNA glycosylase
MEKARVNHKFKAIIDNSSKILILGSIPSVKSREYNFYYMHKQNRFWKLLENIYEDDFGNRDLLIKKKLLIKYGIALYDVLESCDISGSSDSSISNVNPVDIKKLIRNTNIEQIYLNGKKAYDLFCRYNPDLISLAIYLPSTSPANARYRLGDLYKKWLIIKK